LMMILGTWLGAVLLDWVQQIASTGMSPQGMSACLTGNHAMITRQHTQPYMMPGHKLTNKLTNLLLVHLTQLHALWQ